MKKISFLRKIRRKIKDKLPKSLRDFIDSKKFFFRRFNDYKLYISLAEKKKAIEIGGPSLIFKTYIPIYPKLKSLDGVNFSKETNNGKRIEESMLLSLLLERKSILVSEFSHELNEHFGFSQI